MTQPYEDDALDDARLCLVLSTALLAIACGAVFAITAGPDAQPGWGLFLLPGLLPLQYVFQGGLGTGALVRVVGLVLVTVISFACYFFATFAIVRTCRRFARHHHHHAD